MRTFQVCVCGLPQPHKQTPHPAVTAGRGDAEIFGGIAPADRADYDPVPLSATLCGLAASPTALTPIVALSAPTMLGVNFTR